MTQTLHGLGLREQSERRGLAAEVHARPYEILTTPLRATHLALVDTPSAEDERRHLAELFAACDRPMPAVEGGHVSADLGPVRLRWSRHTEFSAYTFIRPGAPAEPFGDTALDAVPADWLGGLTGEVVIAHHLTFERQERSPEEIQRLFGEALVVGSRIGGGAGAVWTDFRIHGDGFGRFLCRDMGLTPGQVGRVVQRLMDIEAYRMLALRAFPAARGLAPELNRLEAEVGQVITAIAAGAQCQGDDKTLIERLTELSAEAEQLAAETGYRFSAARAYYPIVWRNIQDLREQRIAGTQTIAEFMGRRLTPAQRTVDAAQDRLEALGRRVNRASSLLRTRVDIALEENNADLLRSMNKRAEMQLRLQETVEGLSVVAISYYLTGLVYYLLKGGKAVGVGVDPDVALLVVLPAVVAMVWLGVKRLRKAVVHKEKSRAESSGG